MTILHADGRASDFNEATVVVRLDLGIRRLLLAGDAEGGKRRPVTDPPRRNSVEADLLRNPTALRSDLLFVGHHGSETSSRRAFLNAVGAKYFVISSGPHPYGRNRIVLPDRAVETELRNRPGLISIWRTYENDVACVRRPAKTGLDDDNPGGCDNIRITIDRDGRIAGIVHRP